MIEFLWTCSVQQFGLILGCKNSKDNEVGFIPSIRIMAYHRHVGSFIDVWRISQGKGVACDPTYLWVACDPTYLVG